MKEFDSVIGYENVKMELAQIADVLKNPQPYRQLGVVVPRGLMIYGAPGLGKTLLATTLLRASGRKSFTCRKDKSGAEFVKQLRETFEAAEAQAPSIVFLDDMDKFANSDDNHRDAEEYVTVQSCIDSCREKDVFVLATVNALYKLPNSLLRAGRFDCRIKIEAPCLSDAELIIQHYLSEKKTVSDLDSALIARIMYNRSCAELETVLNQAGLYAGFERSDCIKEEHFLKAYLEIIHGISFDSTKDRTGIEKSERSANAVNAVTCHEAGHAVVQEILFPESVLLVYADRDDSSNAFTQILPNSTSVSTVSKEITVMLGGAAAADRLFAIKDSGFTEDFARVFNYAETMIKDGGFRGLSFHSGKYTSDSQLTECTAATLSEVERCFDKAKRLLCLNLDFLKKTAEELNKKHLLTMRDIQRIKATCKIVPISVD